MFFSNGLKAGWLHLFSTHPPLTDRITRLEPGFNGVFPKVERLQEPAYDSGGADTEIKSDKKTPLGKEIFALAVLAADPQNITRDIGAPVREHMESARRLLDSLPAQVREAARNPFGARAVIYCLLLDKDPDVRRRQLELLQTSADQPVFQATEKIVPLMPALSQEARLPLMDLAMPSLRSLSQEQFRHFKENVNRLVRIDKRVSLFELTLEHVVVRRLERNFVTPQRTGRVISSVQEAAAEVSCILSLLAHVGHDTDEAGRAFASAAAVFGKEMEKLRFLSRDECLQVQLNTILDRLSQLSPKIKQLLVTACFQCLVHDRRITVKEAEIFRLLTYSLEIPLPPWVRI